MASFITMTREMTAADNQLGSKQDITFEYQDETQWIGAIMDGHGNKMAKNHYSLKYEKHNFCVEAIKQLKQDGQLRDILSAPISSEMNPAILLQQALGNEAIKYQTGMLETGATLALVQIRHIEDKIKVSTLSVGDSTIMIHCNGEVVYETTPHDSSNQAELDRLVEEGRFRDPNDKLFDGNSFEFMDDSYIISRIGKYINTMKITLAMTQSIGHLEYSTKDKSIVDPLGALGLYPEIHEFEFADTDDINIKAFSDGVSDMVNRETIPTDTGFLVTSDAQETVDFATSRWKKEWKYCNRDDYENGKDNKETINSKPFMFGPNGMDDVSCICWKQCLAQNE